MELQGKIFLVNFASQSLDSMNNDNWRIRKVIMEGLLHEHNLHWNLHPKVNILGGVNGSGKSTLLHAMAKLLNVAKGKGRNEEQSVHDDAPFDLLKVEFDSGMVVELNRIVNTSRFRVESSANGKLHVKLQPDINFRQDVKAKENETALLPAHVIYIGSSDLALGFISKLAECSRADDRPTKTTLDLMLEDALNTRNQLFAQRMSVAMQQGDEEMIATLRSLFSRFEEAISKFMPGYVLLDTSRLLFSPASNRNVNINYFSLSTGEKQLLYILLKVCNTLGESTILLLDEADTGMHIDWKKILLKEILKVNPNIQIIAATHSPSLIDGWYDNVSEMSQLFVRTRLTNEDNSNL